MLIDPDSAAMHFDNDRSLVILKCNEYHSDDDDKEIDVISKSVAAIRALAEGALTICGTNFRVSSSFWEKSLNSNLSLTNSNSQSNRRSAVFFVFLRDELASFKLTLVRN